MTHKQVWKTQLYDDKLAYVSEMGREVVELLQPTKGEHILDLGCGTGDLAQAISAKGAEVTGMDLSAEMIEEAGRKYPHIAFRVGNAERLQEGGKFDAVFSNAALHWMKRANDVVAGIWRALVPGGRFVAEFGGQGNVETVVAAICHVLQAECGIDAAARNPWYFPSIAAYSTLLEQQHFQVAYAELFERPTPMKGGEDGIIDWLTGFADPFFVGIPEVDRPALYRKIATRAQADLYHRGIWYIDYKRIRIKAIKPVI